MNPPTQAGAPPKPTQGKPKKGNGITHAVAPRRLRARADRRDRRPRVRRAAGDGRGRRDGALRRLGRRARARHDRRDHRGPARARGRRALRPRPPRPAGLPRRPRRGQARHARRDQALPGRAGRVRDRPHADRRDGRPGERARGRRHRGDDRLRGAPGGRLAVGHRVGARAHQRPELGRRRRRRARARPARRRDLRGPALERRRAALRPQPADRQLRRLRRGRLGDPARAAGHLRGGRARLVRHPLRAAGGGDAGPLPHRRRAPGGRDHPVVRDPRGHVADQDPLRPRHRRAADPAGRPRLDPGRRQDDRPPRRDASRAVRRERRDAHPGLLQGDDQHGAARHAAAGDGALHEGLRPVARRRARRPARPAPASRRRSTRR